MTCLRRSLFALLLAWGVGAAGLAVAAEGGEVLGSATGLPLPRFVSLGADKANARTGPGKRYPISWVFVRRGWPLRVVAEFENWRKVRDLDGAEGWVHKSLLSGRRTAVVVDKTRALLSQPSDRSTPVLRAEAGVVGKLLACRTGWCRMEVAGISGWIPRDHIFGELSTEKFD